MKIELSPEVILAKSPRPAEWLRRRLLSNPLGITVVGSVVPTGFEAVVRVLHPATRFKGNNEGEEAIRWSEIAAQVGVKLHSLTHWETLERRLPLGSGVRAPAVGQLPVLQGSRLLQAVERFSDAEDVWMLFWNGFAGISPTFDLAAEYVTPTRTYRLAKCDFTSLRDGKLFRKTSVAYFMPSVWWPTDRAWCAATEVDARSTLVAGSVACIDAILESKDLETFRIHESDRFDLGGDPLV